MGINALIKSKVVDPCEVCKHEVFEQVDQFTYAHYCAKDMPKKAFCSGCGCYKFKKRKDICK